MNESARRRNYILHESVRLRAAVSVSLSYMSARISLIAGWSGKNGWKARGSSRMLTAILQLATIIGPESFPRQLQIGHAQLIAEDVEVYFLQTV